MHCGLILHNSFGKLCKWSHCVHFGSSFCHLAREICLCRGRREHIGSQGSAAAEQSEPCKHPQLEDRLKKQLGRKKRQSKEGKGGKQGRKRDREGEGGR